MKAKAILFVVCIIFVNPAFGEELTQEKKGVIKELIEISGAANIGEMFGKAFVQQMTAVLQSTNPDIPQKAFTILEEEINDVMKEELIEKNTFNELLYPIYHKYLTLTDITELLAFYKTPVGKKVIAVMPQLTQESMIAGQSWGQSIGPVIDQRIRERFEKEGIALSQ